MNDMQIAKTNESGFVPGNNKKNGKVNQMLSLKLINAKKSFKIPSLAKNSYELSIIELYECRKLKIQ